LLLVSWRQAMVFLALGSLTLLLALRPFYALFDREREAGASIMFSGENGTRPRVIVITSANPGDGKTTVCCNLAIAMAEIGRRVLLVDADLRKPRVHHVFGLDNERGLVDILKSGPVADELIAPLVRPTSVANLFALTSGPETSAAANLLFAGHMPALKPSEEEQVITLLSLLRVHGTVVDADTGQPIPKFKAIPGLANADGINSFWVYGTMNFTNGQYEMAFDEMRHAHVVRVEADGYLPATSRGFNNDEGSQVADFRLKKGNGPTGIVLLPNGSPAAGVDVILIHRLLKNPIAAKSYVLLTDPAFALLQPQGIPFETLALSYDDVGRVQARVHAPAAAAAAPVRFLLLRKAWNLLVKTTWDFRFRGRLAPERLAALPEGDPTDAAG